MLPKTFLLGAGESADSKTSTELEHGGTLTSTQSKERSPSVAALSQRSVTSLKTAGPCSHSFTVRKAMTLQSDQVTFALV